MSPQTPHRPSRRGLLALGPGLAASVALRPVAAGAAIRTESTAEAIRRFAGAAEIHPGRIHLDLPPLVENGNAVTITVTVDSPMTPEDHVRRIAVFNDKNPQPNVVTVYLGSRGGRAAITTRIRLADTQRITAVAGRPRPTPSSPSPPAWRAEPPWPAP